MQRASKTASVWAFAVMALLLLVAGCAGHSGSYSSSAPAPTYAPTHYYPPPGPPDDPWGPYINEAATRFQIPGQWIRAVMQQESGGEEQAVSPVGAMGLMQLMPATYQGLEAQYGLGEDPFDPQNNIQAGAAYIQQMYQRYGAPGFLAAYNAGPENVDEYLAGNSPLPDETVNYLADITPNLGTQVAFSGPFANYASTGTAGSARPSLVDFASGCDPNAAYDPSHPCTATPQTGTIAGQPVVTASASSGACDSNGAYDPDDPCSANGTCNADNAYDPDSPCAPVQQQAQAPVQTAQIQPETASQLEPAPASPQPDCNGTAFNPACPGSVLASVDSAPRPVIQAVQPAGVQPSQSVSGNWGVQVGAFTSAALAQNVAQNARGEAADALGDADVTVSQTTPFGGNVLYQARLMHISKRAAVEACSDLNRRQLPCEVVRPPPV